VLERIISAPKFFMSEEARALTEPLVAMGMKNGVWISPCAVFKIPRRAEDFLDCFKMVNIFLVCHPERSDGISRFHRPIIIGLGMTLFYNFLEKKSSKKSPAGGVSQRDKLIVVYMGIIPEGLGKQSSLLNTARVIAV
jgi:hypothetical protein